MECVFLVGNSAGSITVVERVEKGVLRGVERWLRKGVLLTNENQIEGMVTGLQAGQGSMHVLYHFSLGWREDVTRIPTQN